MSWALFRQKAAARPFWLATASGLALVMSPAFARTADPDVADAPSLQTPAIDSAPADAPKR